MKNNFPLEKNPQKKDMFLKFNAFFQVITKSASDQKQNLLNQIRFIEQKSAINQYNMHLKSLMNEYKKFVGKLNNNDYLPTDDDLIELFYRIRNIMESMNIFNKFLDIKSEECLGTLIDILPENCKIQNELQYIPNG